MHKWASLIFRTIFFIPTFILFIPIRLGLAVAQLVLAVFKEIVILLFDLWDDSMDFWEVGAYLMNEWRGGSDETEN